MPCLAEIQLLRSILVLAIVCCFTPAFRWAQGGFLGVDVFLVISGCLIGPLLNWQISPGTFLVGDFYRPRAWRLMPAHPVKLLVVGAVFCLAL